MPRVKKRGLDYFPMNTDFMSDRVVRRVMKREGDSVIAVLLETLSYIYAGEGYYVCANQLFYEDIATNLYDTDIDKVKRILCQVAEYGLFDQALFEKQAILTSAEIQRQFLFSTKRRNISALEPAYCLLAEPELAALQPKKTAKKPAQSAQQEMREDMFKYENATLIPENATFNPENATFGTHSIAQHSIAQHSAAENSKVPPPSEPLDEKKKREEEREEEGISFSKGETETPHKRKEWTNETIATLRPPTDNTVRNYEGLLYNLRLYGIPPAEQYAIIRKSDYGAIGGAVWKGFGILRDSNGKIKLPGRYLLSVLNK